MTLKTRFIGPVLAFAVVFFSFLPASGAGQTLDDILRMVESENPELKALSSEYLASVEKIAQARGLPDPQLSAGIFLRPMERYMGDQTAGFQAMQMFPWPGTLGDAGREAAAMAQARFETWREARSRLLFDVKAAWYAFYILNRELSITRETLILLHSLEEIARTQFSVGESGTMPGKPSKPGNSGKIMSGAGSGGGMERMAGMSGGDTLKATSAATSAMRGAMPMPAGSGAGLADLLLIRMEILEIENRLEFLDDDRAVAAARLNGFMDRNPREPIELPEALPTAEMPLSPENANEKIGRNNPMLKMLESEGLALSAKESMDRKMGRPMFGLGLQYETFRPRRDQEGHDRKMSMLMPMVTVSIPLWRKKYTAAIGETRLQLKALEDKERDARNRLTVGYEEALARFRDAERRIALSGELAGLARQALDIMTAGYSTGGSDFEEILRLQRRLLDLRLKLIEAEADRNIAVALVERLMGE
jgi:outer membrane protein TolC